HRQIAVAVPARQIGFPQVGGGRTERPVGEQVPAGADRSQPPSGGGSPQLSPPAVHLRQAVAGQGQGRGEIRFGRNLRAAALVHRRDPQRGRAAQRPPLQFLSPLRAERGEGGGAYRVVGVLPHPPGGVV